MSERKYALHTGWPLGLFGWLGDAFWVGNQPGMNFWDGVVWVWYVGRYMAAHFTKLT